MGDRCYLVVKTSERFVEALSTIIGYPRAEAGDPVWEVDKQGFASLDIEEANCALYDEFCEAAVDGCVFFGWHSAGDDYPAHRFASDGDGEYDGWECEEVDHHCVVRLNDNGEVDERGLYTARRFLDRNERATKILRADVLAARASQ